MKIPSADEMRARMRAEATARDKARVAATIFLGQPVRGVTTATVTADAAQSLLTLRMNHSKTGQ